MRVHTHDGDDENPVTLDWTNREHDDTISVQVWMGHDGVPVVQIDTPEKIGRVRINLNDAVLWDGDPETGQQYLTKYSTISAAGTR